MRERGGTPRHARFNLAMTRVQQLVFAWSFMRPERVTEEPLDLSRGKWTANMTKDLGRGLDECLEMLIHIGEQQLEGATMMIMRHGPPRDTPEPFDAVGIWIIGRRIDQVQVLFQFGEPYSRTSREPADVWVLRLEASTMATRPRCSERATAARTCSQNTSAVRPGATRPSNQPSRETEQTKAVFGIGGCFVAMAQLG